MSLNKLSHNTYEAFFNGSGLAFLIERDSNQGSLRGSRWHVNIMGRRLVGSLSQCVSALNAAADHAIAGVK